MASASEIEGPPCRDVWYVGFLRSPGGFLRGGGLHIHHIVCDWGRDEEEAKVGDSWLPSHPYPAPSSLSMLWRLGVH